jgi:hypothetical protein
MNDVSSLHPRTEATLQDLESANWFSSVGQPVSGVIVVSSWSEAIKHCGSDEWEALTQEADNRYCVQLQKRAPERFQKWNEIVREVKLKTVPLVDRKIAKVVEENKLPKVFGDTVDWDILGVCMESEYADVFPPGFFAAQAYWYVQGHFPCGWRGEFPEGTRIIY